MKMFDTGKTRMIGLPYGGKTMTISYMVLERNGQTDRQTDRFAISILRVSMLTRDKNIVIRRTFSSHLRELKNWLQN